MTARRLSSSSAVPPPPPASSSPPPAPPAPSAAFAAWLAAHDAAGTPLLVSDVDDAFGLQFETWRVLADVSLNQLGDGPTTVVLHFPNLAARGVAPFCALADDFDDARRKYGLPAADGGAPPPLPELARLDVAVAEVCCARRPRSHARSRARSHALSRSRSRALSRSPSRALSRSLVLAYSCARV